MDSRGSILVFAGRESCVDQPLMITMLLYHDCKTSHQKCNTDEIRMRCPTVSPTILPPPQHPLAPSPVAPEAFQMTELISTLICSIVF